MVFGGGLSERQPLFHIEKNTTFALAKCSKMLYTDSHKIALPALMENDCFYNPAILSLLYYAAENKMNTENRSNYGNVYGFDYGNGYTSTTTESLTSNYCLENACIVFLNMNGRLYDPVIGRFFSPDKYVANTSSTQAFNRYTYANNCPLMYTDPDGEIAWFIPLIYIGVTAAINVAVNYKAIQETAQDKGGWAAFGKAMGFFALGAVDGAVSWYCPALSPIVGIGTNILNQGLAKNGFKDINYGQVFAGAAISIGTSAFSNSLVNSTLGKADFFTQTLAGNMMKSAISKNISGLASNLIMSGIYNNGDFSKGWEYYKKTGWWRYTLQGMNDGMKTHYQNSDIEAQYKKDYKNQMKDREFRQNLTKTMKDDPFLSKFDRFELQMHRLMLPINNPIDFIKSLPSLQINITVEPEIPTPTIHLPNYWEIWGW